jgi:hypothetical protein
MMATAIDINATTCRANSSPRALLLFSMLAVEDAMIAAGCTSSLNTSTLAASSSGGDDASLSVVVVVASNNPHNKFLFRVNVMC